MQTHSSNFARLPSPAIVAAITGFALCLAFAGCSVVTKTQNAESGVDYQTAYGAARILTREEAESWRASMRGSSMNPVYGENSVIVVTPIDYDELEPGMKIVYRNRAGKRVLHRLVRREGPYWIARGLNNVNEDAERVTPENLLGVLYAVFYNTKSGNMDAPGD